jgi:hypothetical protein
MIMSRPTSVQAPIARALSRNQRSERVNPRDCFRTAHHSAGVRDPSMMALPVAVTA